MKKSIAFFLCFFLGSFGAHRFYLKRKMSGFVMLIFSLILIIFNESVLASLLFLILFIWCIVDLVTILCGGLGIKEHNLRIKKAEQFAHNMMKTMQTVTHETPETKAIIKLEPLEIYSYDKPQIMNFVSDKDYRMLLQSCYCGRLYGTKTNLNLIMGEYPYEKYDWNTLLQIVWTFQKYHKQIKALQNMGIKKGEFICFENCECCAKMKNKKIFVNKIPELPRLECPLETRICVGARINAVVEF